ncbi:MAG: 30S ribosomal protein S20 [Armatimonadota bacterium]
MANLRSAIRDIRKSRRRAERNQSVRSAIKTYMKKSRTAIESGAEETGQVVSQTSSILDKAAKRGIIHPNAANRRKARLAKLQKQQAATAEAQTA